MSLVSAATSLQPVQTADENRAELFYAMADSSLGIAAVARSASGVCAIHFGMNQDEVECDLLSWFPGRRLVADMANLQGDLAEVVACVDRPCRGLNISLDVRHGTDFQQEVWRVIRSVRCGDRITIADIAKRLSVLHSEQAIAEAVAANTIAMRVPSHRVLQSDNPLLRFRWGEWRQRVLLAREIWF